MRQTRIASLAAVAALILGGCAGLIPTRPAGEQEASASTDTRPSAEADAASDRPGAGEEDTPGIDTGETAMDETETADAPVPAGHPGFRILAQGDQSAVRVPITRVVRGPGVFSEFWRAITANDASRPPEPEADFGNETVIVVLMGERPTSGYAVRPVSVNANDGVVSVALRVTSPAPGDMVAQVLTSPYVLFAIPGTGDEIVIGGDSPGAGFEGD